jgi:hypothetical protein
LELFGEFGDYQRVGLAQEAFEFWTGKSGFGFQGDPVGSG